MSREGKWTPGPWKLESGDKGPVITFAGWPLALVVNTRPDHQANARLIAAAPQMAEALRDALGWIDTNGNRRGEARMPWACAEAMRAALRAAGVEP